MTNRPSLVAGAFAAVLGIAVVSGACGSSNSPTSPGAGGCVPTQTNPECVNPPDLFTVMIKNGVFSPNPITIKAGQRVNWANSDSIAHTATDPGVFDTGSIAPTSAADGPVTFNTAGTFNYHCTIHSGESASIVVTSSSADASAARRAMPLFALTSRLGLQPPQ